jgi:hypothetical protein
MEYIESAKKGDGRWSWRRRPASPKDLFRPGYFLEPTDLSCDGSRTTVRIAQEDDLRPVFRYPSRQTILRTSGRAASREYDST